MAVVLAFVDRQRNLEMAVSSSELRHPRMSSSAYFVTRSPGMERLNLRDSPFL